jgi:hypothetical protein
MGMCAVSLAFVSFVVYSIDKLVKLQKSEFDALSEMHKVLVVNNGLIRYATILIQRYWRLQYARKTGRAKVFVCLIAYM